ncbi:AAA family ATPase [Actinomadura macrotermitis]|uniref:ATPase AAA-type core domain-containing protein n=1 Tax=Actinomadura macrotermitis TaxID=2585200 RepID=A0A7K0C732_9ACTN|nr:AAA family ATPase [Actinomadura macrotermitis]MQY09270.1 hypothetical protein [Actinomadura macrotermitis]
MTPHIPERFMRRVRRHLVAASCFPDHPLLMMIQGPPGDGKSYQLAQTLREWQVALFVESGAQLSGRMEAASLDKLRGLLEAVELYCEKNPGAWPAIVLEDFDLSPAGQRDDVRYTVNSQLLTGALMNLAEGVPLHGSGRVPQRRIPIFITGNDFSILHGPLMRPGRMDIFTWEPNAAERFAVIAALIRRHIPRADDGAIHKLLKAHPRAPVAAFSAAVRACLADRALEYVTTTGSMDIEHLRHRFGDVAALDLGLDEVAAALEQSAEGPRSFLGGRR